MSIFHLFVSEKLIAIIKHSSSVSLTPGNYCMCPPKISWYGHRVSLKAKGNWFKGVDADAFKYPVQEGIWKLSVKGCRLFWSRAHCLGAVPSRRCKCLSLISLSLSGNINVGYLRLLLFTNIVQKLTVTLMIISGTQGHMPINSLGRD